MNLKVVGGIAIAIILIVVIIVLIVYRKSFFSKKSSQSTTDDNKKESSTDSGEEQEEEQKEVESPSVTEDESDETNFQEENVSGGGGANYEMEENDEQQEDVEEVDEQQEDAEEVDEPQEDAGEVDNFFDDEFESSLETNYEQDMAEPEEPEEQPFIRNVTEQECADAGGTNYFKCPQTGVTYCCGLCDNHNMVSCPSSIETPCSDRVGDVNEETGKSEACQTHSDNGNCFTDNPSHHDWRFKCVKTCGYCDDERYNVPTRCACIGELTKENSDLVGYALKYSDLYRAFEFDKEKLWNHWVNNGKNEKRIMNPLLPMDDLYNQEGFPAYPMPTHPAWGKLKNDDGNIIFEDGWIWHLPMPSRTEVPTGKESIMLTNPIDTCKFYRDFNNELGMDHPVKLYVNVDDYGYIIHNNKYITKINGFQNNPGVDLTLSPGKNRIMIVACNTGGPAGLQVAMMDDVNDAPLLSTAVQSSWRYINDIYKNIGFNYNLQSSGDWEGCAMLKVPNNDVDVDGKHTFWYCYNNTSGVVINGQIVSRCDDFVVIWHERKLLLAKGMNDPEPCFVKIRPGKNLFAFSVSNYAGPGWIAAKCTNRDNNHSLLWKTETNGRWGYHKSNWYPGPAEEYETYEHSNLNNNGSRSGWKRSFRYGNWSDTRLASKGFGNDQMSSAKVPRGMQVVNFQDRINNSYWNQTLFANHTFNNLSINDKITEFIVQTPQYNRALFYAETYARRQYKYPNTIYDTHNTGLAVGNYNRSAMEAKGIPNDHVDDIQWPKGMKVEVYENDNYTGTKKTFDYHGSIQKQSGIHIPNKNTSIKVFKDESEGYTDYQVFNDNLLGSGNVEKFLYQ